MKDLGLSKKNIFVTGGDGFLGKYIIKALWGDGANVYSVDVKSSEISYGLDISNVEDIKKYVNALRASGIIIDGMINNAAVSFKGGKNTPEQFLRTLEINVQGTYNCMTLFKPILSKNASIVNVSSIYGYLSPDFRIYEGNEELFSSPAYGASKAAINQLTRYYAAQYAPIRVNSITPGGILQNHKDSFSEKYSNRVPLKRMANPEEIVDGMLFLLSPMSSYITGHNLIVDGGLGIW
jgi:NAD(P)-dependent dehydrogenase (short-subunit alcohol dehydrogenase family)